MPARTIVLDVDTGTDDALALLYAVAHPDLTIRAVSCVAGNASLERVVANTQQVLDAAGAPDIPVGAGARKALVERVQQESAFHGEDGLAGIVLPATARTVSPLNAVELLRQQVVEADSPVTLVALAPQTNIALLLTLHPEVTDHLERIVFMGGSASVGNVTAVAEFNVWLDPEAATCVLESGVPTAMYGLDVFNRLTVEEEHARRYAASDHPAQQLVGELLLRRGARADGLSSQAYVGGIGDAGALVYLTRPELFTVGRHPVRVDLAGLGRGQTVVDRRPVAQELQARSDDPWPTVEVVLDLDVQQAARAFTEVVDAYAA
ncbi:pyrimidine-specific ribonucleoside hydrolase [Friedmanniella luteola]|uniref:Pyrimidine-specific ribonucleoside hydrolase n=1 Tax=Friedmanniella luteola TaxID=546871 RepID=A0A1H1MHI3_9ACTN|nr:nucleoside hydrolase [Friedmanniella luteola]SDR86291.1 pyrimidine-specific ribonucleoside hydrolase [Friedmanniella luteola]